MKGVDFNVLFLAITNVAFLVYALYKAIKSKNYQKALEILAFSIEQTSDKSTVKGSTKYVVKKMANKHRKAIRKVIDRTKDKVVEKLKTKKKGKKILKIAGFVKNVIDFIF